MTEKSMPITASSHTIDSPLAIGAFASQIDILESASIIRGYRDMYGVDVAEYFLGAPRIAVYECQETGYRFYHPFSLAGREELYQQLERFDWNYKPGKWEYDRAVVHIPKASRVLDVGCGRGAFVKIAAQSGLDPHGLELNTSAISVARRQGLSVSAELIGDHAQHALGTYDAVCSFQVLEHIPLVRQFISDCLRVLKPGGKLIFGVPNNDGFLGHDRGAVLNVPPHHMGLWSSQSLSALPKLFPMRLTALELEPLAEIDWYATVVERRHLTRPRLRSAYYRIGLSRLFRWYIAGKVKKIPGHTILAIYEKV
jgi:SAM-dependent methyltransferase